MKTEGVKHDQQPTKQNPDLAEVSISKQETVQENGSEKGKLSPELAKTIVEAIDDNEALDKAQDARISKIEKELLAYRLEMERLRQQNEKLYQERTFYQGPNESAAKYEERLTEATKAAYGDEGWKAAYDFYMQDNQAVRDNEAYENPESNLSDDPDDRKREQERTDNNLRAVETNIKNLEESYQRGDISEEVYTKRRAKFDAVRDRLALENSQSKPNEEGGRGAKFEARREEQGAAVENDDYMIGMTAALEQARARGDKKTVAALEDTLRRRKENVQRTVLAERRDRAIDQNLAYNEEVVDEINQNDTQERKNRQRIIGGDAASTDWDQAPITREELMAQLEEESKTERDATKRAFIEDWMNNENEKINPDVRKTEEKEDEKKTTTEASEDNKATEPESAEGKDSGSIEKSTDDKSGETGSEGRDKEAILGEVAAKARAWKEEGQGKKKSESVEKVDTTASKNESDEKKEGKETFRSRLGRVLGSIQEYARSFYDKKDKTTEDKKFIDTLGEDYKDLKEKSKDKEDVTDVYRGMFLGRLTRIADALQFSINNIYESIKEMDPKSNEFDEGNKKFSSLIDEKDEIDAVIEEKKRQEEEKARKKEIEAIADDAIKRTKEREDSESLDEKELEAERETNPELDVELDRIDDLRDMLQEAYMDGGMSPAALKKIRDRAMKVAREFQRKYRGELAEGGNGDTMVPVWLYPAIADIESISERIDNGQFI